MVALNFEFLKFPKLFNELSMKPQQMEVGGETWKSPLILLNTATCGVLYKVSCSSNQRIEIDDCADILLPGNETSVPFRRKAGDSNANDDLTVLYCLVVRQWRSEGASALRCLARVKKQNVMTKRKIIKTVQIAKAENTRWIPGQSSLMKRLMITAINAVA